MGQRAGEEARMSTAAPARGPGGCVLGLGSLLLTLMLVELLLRLVHPLADPAADLRRGTLVSWPGSPYVPSAYAPHTRLRAVAEPGLPGIDRATRHFSTDNLGYRGDSLARPKPAGELRIFMVGGSTTECVFLDDREAVTARLQAYLRNALPGVDVHVYGAGRSGDRSWDHVAMTAHRLAHLQPDVIIVFAGINDVLAGVRGRDYLLEPDSAGLSTNQTLALLLTNLQLGRLGWAARYHYVASTGEISSSYRPQARRVAALRLMPLPRVDATPYGENLRTLSGIAEAAGARMVLMTQATSWNSPDPAAARWHWMTGSRVMRARYPEAGLDSLMEVYNQRMRAVGAARGVPVFDLARVLPRSTRYLYDDVHFNVRGADTAALLLARYLVAQGVVARTDSAAASRP
jgi:lysophospholipase L1-like esterase